MSKKRGHLGDENAQRVLREQGKNADRQAEEDLRSLMQLAPFRRYLLRTISGVCGVFGDTFTGNSETFWREGKRAVGITLMQEAQRVAPDLYVQAMTEAHNLRRAAESARDTAVRAAEEADE